MNPANDLLNHLLRLGDSALVQGQRLCEWCGRAPALEEELALMNVGLDLVGQARNWTMPPNCWRTGGMPTIWPFAATNAPTATCCWWNNPMATSR